MPIIASIEITGIEKNQGNRLKQSTIPTIKAGDTGAKKRLQKMMAKTLTGDLNDWTHDQLVNWTSNAAKEIAKARNKKRQSRWLLTSDKDYETKSQSPGSSLQET